MRSPLAGDLGVGPPLPFGAINLVRMG